MEASPTQKNHRLNFALLKRLTRGSIGYLALGGLCLGVIETLGITVSSASFRDIFAFIFLILMLLIRPEGFASKKGARP